MILRGIVMAEQSVIDKLKAYVQYYIIRPILNRSYMKEKGITKCWSCGDLLEYYEDIGFTHVGLGDVECNIIYGVDRMRFK